MKLATDLPTGPTTCEKEKPPPARKAIAEVNGGVLWSTSNKGFGRLLAVNPMVYATIIASPRAVSIPSSNPLMMLGSAKGRVTDLSVCHRPAPSASEASFSVPGTL